jgi:cytochrome P450
VVRITIALGKERDFPLNSDSGCLYNLSKNPDCLKKLAELLQSTYARECDITLRKLAQLPYLQAVLDESMRLYMPVPASLPRTVPLEGAISESSA